jgi:hypothetical protein
MPEHHDVGFEMAFKVVKSYKWRGAVCTAEAVAPV